MKERLMLILGCLSIIYIIQSCKEPTQTKEFEFYYYPAKNVYYDVEKNLFLYSLNGAKDWVKFNGSESKVPEELGEKVVIKSKEADVFRENETHRRDYRGILINILPDTAETQPEVVAARKGVQIKRTPTARQNTTNKGKKGIGKFIDKIFGKNKK